MRRSPARLTHLLRIVAIALGVAAPAHAQTAGPQSVPETKVDASKGGITVSSGVNSLTIGARMQFRWTVEDRDEASADLVGAGVGRDDGPVSQFDIPRIRGTLSGGVFRPWMRYLFQFEFSRTGGESASKVKDAVLEFRPLGQNYRLLAGQFKAPFGLQQLTSSGRLQFVDRAITDAKFNPAREMGVMVSGTAARRKLGYDAGVFNGAGESVRQNARSHLWVGRVYGQPLGAYPLSEGGSDHLGPPALHLGIGARAGRQIRGRTAAGIVEDADNQTAWNAELGFKIRRISTTAEYFWMTDEQANPVVAGDIDSRGFHAQAGYMLRPRHIELGILVSRVTPDTRVNDAAVTELRGVVSYYLHAHGLKLQADIGQLGYGSKFGTLSERARQGLPAQGPRLASGRSLSDTQMRIQLQVAF